MKTCSPSIQELENRDKINVDNKTYNYNTNSNLKANNNVNFKESKNRKGTNLYYHSKSNCENSKNKFDKLSYLESPFFDNNRHHKNNVFINKDKQNVNKPYSLSYPILNFQTVSPVIVNNNITNINFNNLIPTSIDNKNLIKTSFPIPQEKNENNLNFLNCHSVFDFNKSSNMNVVYHNNTINKPTNISNPLILENNFANIAQLYRNKNMDINNIAPKTKVDIPNNNSKNFDDVQNSHRDIIPFSNDGFNNKLRLTKNFPYSSLNPMYNLFNHSNNQYNEKNEHFNCNFPGKNILNNNINCFSNNVIYADQPFFQNDNYLSKENFINHHPKENGSESWNNLQNIKAHSFPNSTFIPRIDINCFSINEKYFNNNKYISKEDNYTIDQPNFYFENFTKKFNHQNNRKSSDLFKINASNNNNKMYSNNFPQNVTLNNVDLNINAKNDLNDTINEMKNSNNRDRYNSYKDSNLTETTKRNSQYSTESNNDLISEEKIIQLDYENIEILKVIFYIKDMKQYLEKETKTNIDHKLIFSIKKLDDLFSCLQSFCEQNMISEDLEFSLLLNICQAISGLSNINNVKISKKDEDQLIRLNNIWKNHCLQISQKNLFERNFTTNNNTRVKVQDECSNNVPIDKEDHHFSDEDLDDSSDRSFYSAFSYSDDENENSSDIYNTGGSGKIKKEFLNITF